MGLAKWKHWPGRAPRGFWPSARRASGRLTSSARAEEGRSGRGGPRVTGTPPPGEGGPGQRWTGGTRPEQAGAQAELELETPEGARPFLGVSISAGFIGKQGQGPDLPWGQRARALLPEPQLFKEDFSHCPPRGGSREGGAAQDTWSSSRPCCSFLKPDLACEALPGKHMCLSGPQTVQTGASEVPGKLEEVLPSPQGA